MPKKLIETTTVPTVKGPADLVCPDATACHSGKAQVGRSHRTILWSSTSQRNKIHHSVGQHS